MDRCYWQLTIAPLFESKEVQRRSSAKRIPREMETQGPIQKNP
ncbi:hypothetical protein BN1224_PB2_A_00140 [Chlamydia pneumoniae]|uniref:Uncharacterized protein n=1 Tax=Chlamydia pneumoniae TaxID=83558 RepID=A0A0F7X5H1_CHLPN|nr:hypothetical protein BN1224_H12_AB_00040 [Chlamydia pneumoniae]CRI47773.1 hypothetical protein BN1224_PB2_A_00140 [Chlamydia pneumoniae]CRI51160.1 hypothetical protein BN1224_UZG1_A_00150 [Chlamydia pneumoniae]CRI52288.1 hypothetical protein BN1224_Wien2_A_00130 [Chlamydia pneumoniae]CRI72648.1 hypothetical protein BN1224_YK41_AB_00120 [Chlamydia pneumoniae]